MASTTWRVCCLIIGLLFFIHSHSEESNFLNKSDQPPPPGFENLNQPQQTIVEIYYGNTYLDTQLVTLTPSWVKLHNPEAIISKINTISDPDNILTELQKPIATNSHLVCMYNQQKNCGILYPDIIGGIYNDSNFRLNLFINSNYLKLKSALKDKYLPASDSGASLIQQFNGVLAGSRGKNIHNTDYTLSNTSIFGYKENNLYLDYDYSSYNDFSLNKIILEREYRGLLLQSGLIASHGFGLSFSRDSTLWGIRASTSMNTHVDKEFLKGSSLQVFLPVRGRVDVLKDGKLIYTTYAEAGNQELNISTFPSGAYPITINIHDTEGNITNSENRFFAHSNHLVLTGEPIYFVEAGKVTSSIDSSLLPSTSDIWLGRAGISYRLNGTTVGSLAVIASNKRQAAEFGLYKIGKSYEVTPSMLTGSDGSLGFKFSSKISLKEKILSFDFRRLTNKKNVDTIEETRNGMIINQRVKTFSILENSFEKADIGIHLPFLKGNGSYYYSYRKQTGFNLEKIQSLRYEKNLYKDNKYNLNSHYSYNQSKRDKLFQATFTLTWRDKQFNHSLSTQGLRRVYDSSNTPNQDYRLRYQTTWNNEDASMPLNAKLSAEKSKAYTLVQSSGSVNTEYGKFSSNIVHVKPKRTSSSTSFNASVSSNLAINEHGIVLGGDHLDSSGIILNIKGLPSSNKFNILVNGRKTSVAKSNKKTLLALRPFETYDVNLEPLEDGFFNFDEAKRNVTLYPGNIASLDYHIKAMKLVFGRLIDRDGKPVENAVISNIKGNYQSDQNGIIQFQMSQEIEQLIVVKNTKKCIIQLSSFIDDERPSLIKIGNYRCNDF